MGFGRGALWPPNLEVHAPVPRNVLVIGPVSCKVPRRQRSDFEQIAQRVAYALVPSVVRFMMKLSLLMMSRLLAACGTETTTAGQHSFIYTTPAGKAVLATLRCGNTTDPVAKSIGRWGLRTIRRTKSSGSSKDASRSVRTSVRGPTPDRLAAGVPWQWGVHAQAARDTVMRRQSQVKVRRSSSVSTKDRRSSGQGSRSRIAAGLRLCCTV